MTAQYISPEVTEYDFLENTLGGAPEAIPESMGTGADGSS